MYIKLNNYYTSDLVKQDQMLALGNGLSYFTDIRMLYY